MVEMLGVYFVSISSRRYPACSYLLKSPLCTDILDIGRAIPFDRPRKVMGSFRRHD